MKDLYIAGSTLALVWIMFISHQSLAWAWVASSRTALEARRACTKPRPTFRWPMTPTHWRWQPTSSNMFHELAAALHHQQSAYQRPFYQRAAWFDRRFSMSTMDTDATDVDVTEDLDSNSNKTLASMWDVPGLKKEVVRLVQRSHKKVQQAHQRLAKAKETVEELATNPTATMEQLEQCPDLDALAQELATVQLRLQRLNTLEELLAKVPNKKQVLLAEPIASLALELDVNDAPPVRPPREKKEKGPRRDTPSRKPYRRYYTQCGIEIRVGKKAEDNDELTLNPLHRDGSDWWMHAAGCPGSHVVIRCSDNTLSDNVIQDAAALAARQSKCTGSVIKVSLTRCRDIKKPPLAKAGLVLLTGNVQTVSVNMKAAEARLERLEGTVLVN